MQPSLTCRPPELAIAAAEALQRIAPIIRRTPLIASPYFSERTGLNVWLKLENQQHTGSFKLRGAANRLMTLDSTLRDAGCVVASSGNHGAAVAYAMKKLGVGGIIFVPEQTSTAKVDAIRKYGGDVRFYGIDGLDTEMHARAYANQHGMFYLSPYNDVDVVAGQGTCGVEIALQLPDLDAAFIAVGGGGLISGVASVLKKHNPAIRIIGCQPMNSPVMARSVEAGHIVELESQPTLSDGTAGGIEANAITFDWCRELVDDFVLVDEVAIAEAMRRYMQCENDAIEGAAGVALAALEDYCKRISGSNVVVIICGGNVSRDTLDRVTVNG